MTITRHERMFACGASRSAAGCALHGPRPRSPAGPTVTLASIVAEPTVSEVVRIEDPELGEGRRDVIVRWSDGTTGRALSYYADETLLSEGDHGNSRLMSPRAEKHRAAGSVRAPRGT
jgi:hypothetical protein